MRRRWLGTALVTLSVAACATPGPWDTSGLYLEPPAEQGTQPVDPSTDFTLRCLYTAAQEVEAGKTLSEYEEAQLGWRDVSGFLHWECIGGLPQCPRAVESNGRPSAEGRLYYVHGDVRVTQRYVVCLLRNGYSWPKMASR